mmetsp:Transcript_34288/g.88621  ORF Transcript_34288/g.88621 Transcript_34288/m.88621 type:complete len:386 (+) Transcript_34288:1463-2620(+)
MGPASGLVLRAPESHSVAGTLGRAHSEIPEIVQILSSSFLLNGSRTTPKLQLENKLGVIGTNNPSLRDNGKGSMIMLRRVKVDPGLHCEISSQVHSGSRSVSTALYEKGTLCGNSLGIKFIENGLKLSPVAVESRKVSRGSCGICSLLRVPCIKSSLQVGSSSVNSGRRSVHCGELVVLASKPPSKMFHSYLMNRISLTVNSSDISDELLMKARHLVKSSNVGVKLCFQFQELGTGGAAFAVFVDLLAKVSNDSINVGNFSYVLSPQSRYVGVRPAKRTVNRFATDGHFSIAHVSFVGAATGLPTDGSCLDVKLFLSDGILCSFVSGRSLPSGIAGPVFCLLGKEGFLGRLKSSLCSCHSSKSGIEVSLLCGLSSGSGAEVGCYT